jgi:phosphatidylglycerol:prolipoprotein diacylglycerol transferase
MTNHWIDPVCFHAGGHPVHWYGLWVAAGFLAAVVHWTVLGRRDGRRAGFGADFGFLVMIAGIVGARLTYVLVHAADYAAHPLDAVRVERGGLIFFGGFALAILAIFGLARWHRLPALRLLDYGVTGLALGHALGRVGCFFGGCCYGLPTRLPWASLQAGELRHPVQLYEAAFNVALWILLTRTYLRKPAGGVVFALYLVLYGIWRFFAEFLRGDARQYLLGLHTAQVVSLASAAVGAILFFVVRRRHA